MALILTSKFRTILEFTRDRINALRIGDDVRIDFVQDPDWESIGIRIFPVSDVEDLDDSQNTQTNKIVDYKVGVMIAIADEDIPDSLDRLTATREQILKSFRVPDPFDSDITGNLSVGITGGEIGRGRLSDNTRVLGTELEISFRVQFAYTTPLVFTAEYGAFTFPVYPEYTKTEVAFNKGFVKEFHLRGIVEGTTSTAIKIARDLLTAALTDGKDIKIKDGSLVLDELLQADTEGGVKVELIEFPTSKDNEWITKRTFSIKFSGIVKEGAGDQKSFIESIERTSSLVRQEPREVINGTTKPIIQTSSLQAAFAVQQGIAVGYSAFPALPAKIFATSKLISEVTKKINPLIQKDGTFTDFQIEWRFEYMDDTDFADTDPTLAVL